MRQRNGEGVALASAQTAHRGTRTPTSFPTADFKSAASTIPPGGHRVPFYRRGGTSTIAMEWGDEVRTGECDFRRGGRRRCTAEASTPQDGWPVGWPPGSADHSEIAPIALGSEGIPRHRFASRKAFIALVGSGGAGVATRDAGHSVVRRRDAASRYAAAVPA
jgi:hypothetical protein